MAESVAENIPSRPPKHHEEQEISPIRNQPSPKRVFFMAFLAAVTLSGFCSLVYQVVWDRLARNNFGGDNTSATIVVAVFLLGLGLGAYLFRRITARHLLIYGIVEIAIGAFALASYHVIGDVALAVASIFKPDIDSLGSIRPATIVGCGLFLLPPSILMGGTLPLMFAAFCSREELSTRSVGLVYGANIIGAMTGTYAVPLLLLNNFSIPTSLWVAASLNFAIGVIAIALFFRFPVAGPRSTGNETSVKRAGASRPRLDRPALYLTFLTGFVTAVLEIVMLRHAFAVIPATAYNFSLVIGSVLLSLGIGSIWLSRSKEDDGVAEKQRLAWLLFASVVGLIASISLAVLVLRHQLLVVDVSHPGSIALYFLLLCAPTFIPLGAIFPILCADVSGDATSLSDRTGVLYVVNSIGAFLGAILFHFVGSVWLGTRLTIVAMAALGVTAALALLWNHRPRLRAIGIAAAAATLVASIAIPMSSFVLGPKASAYPTAVSVEGSSGISTLAWDPATGNGLFFVNGTSMGRMPVEPKHIAQLGVALSVAKPRHVLVLGLGSGSYMRELVKVPTIESITLVDWSHELPRLMKEPAVVQMVGDTLADPRIKLVSGDARLAVKLLPPRSFDLVLDNLVYPTWAGATSVRTASFFANVAGLLTADGLYGFGANYGSRWRGDLLAGLLRNFAHVDENSEAVMVLASNGAEIRQQEDRLLLAVDHLARLYGSDRATYERMLRTGMRPISAREITAMPFSEDRVFSEYPLATLTFFRNMLR